MRPLILPSALLVLGIGGNEALPQYLQWSICDASWSTGARILSSEHQPTTARPTAASAYLVVATYMFFIMYYWCSHLELFRDFSQHLSYSYSFRKRVGRKKKHTEQDQPAVCQPQKQQQQRHPQHTQAAPAAAPAAAATAAVEKQVFVPTLIRLSSLFRATAKPIHVKTELKLVPGTYVRSFLNTARPCL